MWLLNDFCMRCTFGKVYRSLPEDWKWHKQTILRFTLERQPRERSVIHYKISQMKLSHANHWTLWNSFKFRKWSHEYNFSGVTLCLSNLTQASSVLHGKLILHLSQKKKQQSNTFHLKDLFIIPTVITIKFIWITQNEHLNHALILNLS